MLASLQESKPPASQDSSFRTVGNTDMDSLSDSNKVADRDEAWEIFYDSAADKVQTTPNEQLDEEELKLKEFIMPDGTIKIRKMAEMERYKKDWYARFLLRQRQDAEDKVKEQASEEISKYQGQLTERKPQYMRFNAVRTSRDAWRERMDTRRVLLTSLSTEPVLVLDDKYLEEDPWSTLVYRDKHFHIHHTFHLLLDGSGDSFHTPQNPEARFSTRMPFRTLSQPLTAGESKASIQARSTELWNILHQPTASTEPVEMLLSLIHI